MNLFFSVLTWISAAALTAGVAGCGGASERSLDESSAGAGGSSGSGGGAGSGGGGYGPLPPETGGESAGGVGGSVSGGAGGTAGSGGVAGLGGAAGTAEAGDAQPGEECKGTSGERTRGTCEAGSLCLVPYCEDSGICQRADRGECECGIWLDDRCVGEAACYCPSCGEGVGICLTNDEEAVMCADRRNAPFGDCPMGGPP